MTSNSSSVSSAADVDVHGVVVKRRYLGQLGSDFPFTPGFHYLNSLRYDEDGWSFDGEVAWSTPFRKDSIPRVCSCGGLVYMDLEVGNQMVICNPKTKEFKTLPPPPQPCPGPIKTYCDVIGFGFDSESNDYKVVRCVSYEKQEVDEDEYGDEYGPCERPMLVDAGFLRDAIELYSLKTDTWKEIPFPDEFIKYPFNSGGGGAFVGGKYYWLGYDMSSSSSSHHMSSSSSSDELPPSDDFTIDTLILHSFDFAVESLCAPSHLPPLPTTSNSKIYYDYLLVEYVGSLGVVCYEIRGGTGKSKSFSLFLWKEKQQKWCMVFFVDLPSVRRPLGFSKDGRYLFLEEEAPSDEDGKENEDGSDEEEKENVAAYEEMYYTSDEDEKENEDGGDEEEKENEAAYEKEEEDMYYAREEKEKEKEKEKVKENENASEEKENGDLYNHVPDPVSLFVYDISKKELKKLDISDFPESMEIVSYVESTWAPAAGVHPPPPPKML